MASERPIAKRIETSPPSDVVYLVYRTHFLTAILLFILCPCGLAQTSPPAWSPNEPRLAYLLSNESSASLPADWLFGVSDQIGADAIGSAGASDGSCPQSASMELWTTHVKTGRSVRLARADAMTAPAWAPTATAMAVTAIDINSPPRSTASKRPISGVARLTVLNRDGRTTALFEEKGVWPAEELADLATRSSAWSADGLWLAAAWPGRSLLIYSLAEQKIAFRLADAVFPSWSPDSSKLAFFQKAAGFVQVSIGHWKNPQPVLVLVGALQGLTWEDAETLLAVRAPELAGVQTSELELVRVAIAERRQQSLCRVTISGEPSPQKPRGYLALDARGQTAYLACAHENASPRIDVVDLESLGEKQSVWPFATTDAMFRLDGLCVSSDGHYLAMRYGQIDWPAPLAAYPMEVGRPILIAPTRSAAMAGLIPLALTAQRIIEGVTEESPRRNNAQRFKFRDIRAPSVRRTTEAEPAPPLRYFERAMDQTKREISRQTRIDSIAELAISQLDQLEKPPASSQAADRRLAELRLVFCYWRKDYAGALAAVESLKLRLASDMTTDYLACLEIVRAQCLIASGRTQTASELVTRLLAERTRRLDHSSPNLESDELRTLGVTPPSPAATRMAARGSDVLLSRLRLLSADCKVHISDAETP